jgi:aminoglycoside phosphotransferase (APT) family kinase protein
VTRRRRGTRADELFAERFRDCLADVLAAVTANADVLDAAPATFVHDDLRPENCLVDSAGPGLVDWETAVATSTDSGALRAGYRDHAGTLSDAFSERSPLYRAVTSLETARTFEYWAPDAAEPVDDLASRVRDELDVRLDAPDG